MRILITNMIDKSLSTSAYNMADSELNSRSLQDVVLSSPAGDSANEKCEYDGSDGKKDLCS